MTYLLIAFIVFLALAPLSHFVPTRAQRRAARMRERAALEGLFVEFRKLPGSDERLRPSPAGTIFYGLRHRSREEPTQRRQYLRDDRGWREVERLKPALSMDWLEDLPASVEAAETSPDGAGIYWREAGEEADVIEVAKALKRRCGLPVDQQAT